MFKESVWMFKETPPYDWTRRESNLWIIFFRYWLVGFDGIGHRAAPYLQTGNSLVSGSVYNLITALNNLQYRNANRMVSGLDAVKFASKIEFRQASTRIFMLLDSVAIYSGALKEMMEANTLLKNKGIILNTINRYKFKRSKILYYSFLDLLYESLLPWTYSQVYIIVKFCFQSDVSIPENAGSKFLWSKFNSLASILVHRRNANSLLSPNYCNAWP